MTSNADVWNVAAQQEVRPATEGDYRLSHRAPGPELDGTTVRLDQVGGKHDEVFPRDVRQHPEWYGAQYPATLRQLDRAAGGPDVEVQVWRAVPQGVTTINPGDWVALALEYAKGESLAEQGHVITAVVRAGDLWNEGLLEEWGFQGPVAVPAVVDEGAEQRSPVQASFPQSARAAVTTRPTSVTSRSTTDRGVSHVSQGVER